MGIRRRMWINRNSKFKAFLLFCVLITFLLSTSAEAKIRSSKKSHKLKAISKANSTSEDEFDRAQYKYINSDGEHDDNPNYPHLGEQNETISTSSTSTVAAKALGTIRTFISDIIGISALKLMFLFSIPMFFSALFFGAIMVLFVPFPILTSTSGLAGAAAVGRRQGRTSESSSAFDELSILRLLGLGGGDEEEVVGHYAPKYYVDPLVEDPPSAKRVKKQFKLKKFRMIDDHRKRQNLVPFSEADDCILRIACEIGRENKDPHSKGLVNKMIEKMPPMDKLKWKVMVQAYLDGLHSQASQVMVLSSSQGQESSGVPLVGPVYPHNYCPKYKCSL